MSVVSPLPSNLVTTIFVPGLSEMYSLSSSGITARPRTRPSANNRIWNMGSHTCLLVNNTNQDNN